MDFQLVTEDNLDYLRQESTPFNFEQPQCDPDDLAKGIYDYVSKAKAFGVAVFSCQCHIVCLVSILKKVSFK